MINSLQSFETSLLLVAHGRFPHALTNCATAIESVLQASPIGANDRDGLQKLLPKATAASAAVAAFDMKDLEDFRDLRNRIVHRGFSPEDDSVSADLYIGVGLPFLTLCLKEFQSFDLLDGLFPEYGKHLAVAGRVHSLAKTLSNLDLSYCFDSVGHLIRLRFAEGAAPDWAEMADHDEASGAKYERVQERKALFERFGELTWSFDCPVCDGLESVVAELHPDEPCEGALTPTAMTCADCGFSVRKAKPFLCQVLLEDQIPAVRTRILKEYGLLRD